MAAKASFQKRRSLCAALLVGTILGGFAPPALARATERPHLPHRPALSVEAPARAAARSIVSLAVTGNQRLEADTVLSYTNLRPGEPIDRDGLDQALRDLYATELFADIAIAGADTGDLVVQVRENPVINRIVLEGNSRLKNDKITPEIRLAPRQIFTRSRARADVERIIGLYRRQGRYAATVEPQIVQLDQNRVDIVFEIDEGPRSRVRQISILGNERFANAELIEAMASSARPPSSFGDASRYDPARLAFDQERLRQFYLNEGYADFRVVSAVAELTPDRRDFTLTYVVEEGPRYKFGALNVEGDLPDPAGEDLRSGLPMRAGDWYDARQVEDALAGLNERAGRFGYAFADVRPTFDRDPDSLTMGVTFKVAETPRVYVERIDMSGDARSPDKVVRREFRLAQGDPFNTVRVRRSRDRIKSLGFFQENLEIQQAQASAPDRVILGVDVEERDTGELRLSAGFSSLERFLVQLSINQRNFMGRGQELRAGIDWSTYSKAAELGFEEPYLFERNLALGLDVFRRDWSSFNFFGGHDGADGKARIYAAVRGGAPLTEELSFARRYSLALESPAIETSSARDASSTLSADLAGLLDGNAGANGLGISNAGPRISVRPVQVKDSTGNAIRLLDRLDPRSNITADAIGGRTYYLARAELEIPVGASARALGLRPSAFVDFGTVWQTRTAPFRKHFLGDMPLPRVTVGYAVNWNSPLGPFRVDIAQELLTDPRDDSLRAVYAAGPDDDEDEYDGPRHGRA